MTERHHAALFRTVRAAITFAYSIDQFPIAPSPGLGVPEGGRAGTMSSLNAHEKHAQGALIRRSIETRLTPAELVITLAFFGQDRVRAGAIAEVSRLVTKIVRRASLGRELVHRYFEPQERRRTQARIAHDFGTSQQTISRLDREVGNEIERLRIATEGRLEALFVSTGIAEGV